MELSEDSAGLDLSGRWIGRFLYPNDREPVDFEATLEEREGWLSGSTREIGQVGEATDQTLTATLTGRRTGGEVSFLKAYDQSVGRYDAVRYAGQVAAEGTEIDGTWTVPGSWSGTFVMIRAGHPYAAVEVRAGEKVPAG